MKDSLWLVPERRELSHCCSCPVFTMLSPVRMAEGVPKVCTRPVAQKYSVHPIYTTRVLLDVRNEKPSS